MSPLVGLTGRLGFDAGLGSYIHKNAGPDGIIRKTSNIELTDQKLEQLAHVKSLRSLIEPGEAVGVLAAQVQSISRVHMLAVHIA